MVSDYKKKEERADPNWKLPGLMLGYFKKPGGIWWKMYSNTTILIMVLRDNPINYK